MKHHQTANLDAVQLPSPRPVEGTTNLLSWTKQLRSAPDLSADLRARLNELYPLGDPESGKPPPQGGRLVRWLIIIGFLGVGAGFLAWVVGKLF